VVAVKPRTDFSFDLLTKVNADQFPLQDSFVVTGELLLKMPYGNAIAGGPSK